MKYITEIKKLLDIQQNLFNIYFEMVLNGDFKDLKEILDRIYNIEKTINILDYKYRKSLIDDTIIITPNEAIVKEKYITKNEYFNMIGCKENYILGIYYKKYLRILKSKGHNIEKYDHLFYEYYMSNLGRGVKNKTIFLNFKKDYISFINKV